MRTRRFVVLLLATLLTCLGLSGTATASFAMPNRIILTGGAAEVGRTYTATPYNYTFPSDVTLRYSWYRGNHEREAASYKPIPGQTRKQYTLTDADHWYSVRVRVRALRNGSVIGEKFSDPSNWIMYDVTPPTLTGPSLVGHKITGTLGIWATEWQTSVWWRRGADKIPGETGMTYTPTAADAGKSISMVGLGEYTFPNGVHPIDRDVTHRHIRWETGLGLTGTSPSAGQLTLNATGFAKLAPKVPAQGSGLQIREGSRVLTTTYMNGQRTIKLSGLSKGSHTITMVFPTAWAFSSARITRTFTVR